MDSVKIIFDENVNLAISGLYSYLLTFFEESWDSTVDHRRIILSFCDSSMSPLINSSKNVFNGKAIEETSV